MERQVFIFEHEGRAVLGFDTGLDSRSFAQTKFAQYITEPGLIVHSDGKTEEWKASGVIEYAHADSDVSTMVVWGPAFEGECLNAAPEMIIPWIQAVIIVEKNIHYELPECLCAAIINEATGAVFFAPASIARRCMASGEGFIHPDLRGITAAVFTVTAMLYAAYAGTPPFPAADEITRNQDMRDGNFVPVRLAVPGLDTRLVSIIQDTLNVTRNTPRHKNLSPADAETVLRDVLAILRPGGKTVSKDTLIQTPSEAERAAIEKEKERFLKIKNTSVRTKRFVMRNTLVLTVCVAAAVGAALIAFSLVRGRARLPTTAGMDPVQVIETYYNAIGELDHTLMEACVTGDAGKDDIGVVINLFVMSKMRQAYEVNAPPAIISARKWQDAGGGPLAGSRVFGVTGLRITLLTGNIEAHEIDYRVDYIYWLPYQMEGGSDSGEAPEPEALREPVPYNRTEIITLIRNNKGNWLIAEINRED